MNDLILTAVRKAQADLGGEIYLVGGAVRDHLLGKAAHDLDFVVIGRDYKAYAAHIARELRSRTVEFKDNIRIPFRGEYMDLSAPRGDTIGEDLAKRDFTVNNLAMDAEGQIIGDRSDLDRRLLVPVYEGVFEDDPVRILRGFRQAAALDFGLSGAFLSLAQRDMPRLNTVAGERISEELKKLCAAKYATLELYETAESLGLWQTLTLWETDVELLYKSSRLQIQGEDAGFMVYLAVLLHKNPHTLSIMQNLHISRQIEQGVKAVLSGGESFSKAVQTDTERTVWNNRTFFHLLLPFAELVYGLDADTIDRAIKALERITTYNGARLTGDDITTLMPEKPSGRWIGETLNECNFLLTFGRLSSKQEAIACARTLLENGEEA